MKDTADTDRRVVVIFGGRSEIGTELAVRLAWPTRCTGRACGC
jgi:NAD(P)-dependent dehydrogenase (short-subunit alcohol dehydrogenase family)